MTAFKVISAVAITSLVLPQRSFVEAVPRPSPESPSGETGSQVNQATAGSIGQVALQHPQLGLDTLPETGLGIVGNITTGASDAESTAGSMTTAQLAQALNLTSHWVAPFPPLGSSVKAFDFLVDKWQLWHNRLYGGEEENLHFVNDPFTSSNNASSNSSGFSTADSRAATSVLKVDYQTGTYRQGGANSSGGSTFFPYPMELQTLSPTSMKKSLLLKYDVSFDYNFDFVKGGKLPGIFYGSEERDCSGGNLSNDGECFSVRMMWRDNGLGEVYAYLPTSNNLCPASTNGTVSSQSTANVIGKNNTDIICNSDYGTSLGRGKFSFSRGIYTTITMYVALNSAAGVKDGIVQIWAGDIPVVDLRDLILSSETGTDSLKSIKIFFSTFFGGSTPDWASRVDTSTYFRNLEIYTDASGTAESGVIDGSLSKKDRDEENHAPPTLHSRTHSVAIAICYLLALLAALYI